MDVKVCPKCGHKLEDVVIAIYPVATTREECTNCDWMGEYKEHPEAFKDD